MIFSTDATKRYDLQMRSGGYMISAIKFPESLSTWLNGPKVFNGNMISFGMEYFFKAYKFSPAFDVPVIIHFSFEEYLYRVSFMITSNHQEHYKIEKNYGQLMDDHDINNIINEVTKRVFERIKENK
jgi:hypothetical protein